MPDLSLLEKFLESLRLERASLIGKIDKDILDVEEMLRRHSGNGASLIHVDSAQSQPQEQQASQATRENPKGPGRRNFHQKYPGVSLENLITRALESAHGLDLGELQAEVGKMGYDYARKAYDTTLRRMKRKKQVKSLPLPAGRRKGKFQNLWDLVR
jgi:hypothetical protein